MDILGTALIDQYNHGFADDIITYLALREYPEPISDRMSPSYFFRDFEEMPSLEQEALNRCYGKVLDIGCGAGSHSLFLQGKGLDILGVDVSAGAVETSRARGLKNVLQADIMEVVGIKFDTLLLLMNGIGLAGSLDRLDAFLHHLKSLLTHQGQILMDSSDIIYMYQGYENSTFQIPEGNAYYGQGEFIMEYQGKKSDVFPWLYLDFRSLESASKACGLKCERIAEGPHFDYLARLTPHRY